MDLTWGRANKVRLRSRWATPHPSSVDSVNYPLRATDVKHLPTLHQKMESIDHIIFIFDHKWGFINCLGCPGSSYSLEAWRVAEYHAPSSNSHVAMWAVMM